MWLATIQALTVSSPPVEQRLSFGALARWHCQRPRALGCLRQAPLGNFHFLLIGSNKQKSLAAGMVSKITTNTESASLLGITRPPCSRLRSTGMLPTSVAPSYDMIPESPTMPAKCRRVRRSPKRGSLISGTSGMKSRSKARWPCSYRNGVLGHRSSSQHSLGKGEDSEATGLKHRQSQKLLDRDPQLL